MSRRTPKYVPDKRKTWDISELFGEPNPMGTHSRIAFGGLNDARVTEARRARRQTNQRRTQAAKARCKR